MTRILITGGGGFIGTSLALALKDTSKYDVTIVDNYSPQIHGENYKNSELYNKVKDRINIVVGDIRNRDLMEKLILDTDLIVHLAAETGTGQSMYDIFNYTDVNVNGTALILDIIANKARHIKKFIFASTRALYGEGKYLCDEHGTVYPEQRNTQEMEKGDFNVKCPVCNNNVKLVSTTEDTKLTPTSVYGITKQAQEQLIINVGEALDIPCVGLRYQNVYGPGQSLKNPYTGILSIFSTRIKNNKPINIFEDGNESRDFVFIDDVINATMLAIEKDDANNQLFNVGTGRAVSVIELVELLYKEYNEKPNYSVTGNFRIGDIAHNYADLSKIEKLLSFKPTVTFEEGIKHFVAWVNQQEVQDDNFDESIEEMKKKGLFK